jgi:hypothetical protein
MGVRINVSGQPTVVADVIAAGSILKQGATWCIYTGSVWIVCDGSELDRDAYAALFTVIHTIYGAGDGEHTFNIPTQATASRTQNAIVSTTVFPSFNADADVIVNNPSAASIDISSGATGPGITITIIEQSAQGVTIYTDAGHTQQAFLGKGVLVLKWDNVNLQWCLVSESARIIVPVTATGVFKTPFAALYTLTAIGAGGGAGSAYGSGNFSSGGGASGYFSRGSKYLAAGVILNATIGVGGVGGSYPNPGSVGTLSSITDNNGFTISANGGSGSPAALSASGPGGHNVPSQTPSGSIPLNLFALQGNDGANGNNSSSGIGGSIPSYGCGGMPVGPVHNGNPGTGYGSGGGGACSGTGDNQVTGGSGAPGLVTIEF